jgi:hypothetical protein
MVKEGFKLIDVLVTASPDGGFRLTHSSVYPVWSGVDRPITSGWQVRNRDAVRLKRAIMAGAVCKSTRVATDVDGKTYVDHDGHARVSGRSMNADLKRLGF